MPRSEVSDLLRHPQHWRQEFGPRESPVVIAAADPRTTAICIALRGIVKGDGTRLFIVGPAGSGKSAFVAALLAEAEVQGVSAQVLSPSTDPSQALKALAHGGIDLLVVNRLDETSQTVRNSVLEHRGRCRLGLVATAERLTAVAISALTDSRDRVIHLSALEDRPRDVLAISQLLWPGICAADLSFLDNSSDDATDDLCKGPFPKGVTTLRFSLEHLADALVTSGALQGGELRRQIDATDIATALLSAYRAAYSTQDSAPSSVVIVVEGPTDVVYLTGAARVAAEVWGWRLLEGCELLAAGDDRQGGAAVVWRRLFELSARAVECIGLFDNDDTGRREWTTARRQSLRAELLPAEFDRLRLPEEHRFLEIEDLLCLRILDRFYEQHRDLIPEEVRVRFGAQRRVVPQGKDKQTLVDWASREMRAQDCERLIFVLCRLRKRVGLPVPRDNLDDWLKELVKADS